MGFHFRAQMLNFVLKSEQCNFYSMRKYIQVTIVTSTKHVKKRINRNFDNA